MHAASTLKSALVRPRGWNPSPPQHKSTIDLSIKMPPGMCNADKRPCLFQSHVLLFSAAEWLVRVTLVVQHPTPTPTQKAPLNQTATDQGMQRGFDDDVEFAREASWWSVWVNILEARANSRFYRVLLKLYGMHSGTGS